MRLSPTSRHPPADEVVAEQHKADERDDAAIDRDIGVLSQRFPIDLQDDGKHEPENRQDEVHDGPFRFMVEQPSSYP